MIKKISFFRPEQERVSKWIKSLSLRSSISEFSSEHSHSTVTVIEHSEKTYELEQNVRIDLEETLKLEKRIEEVSIEESKKKQEKLELKQREEEEARIKEEEEKQRKILEEEARKKQEEEEARLKAEEELKIYEEEKRKKELEEERKKKEELEIKRKAEEEKKKKALEEEKKRKIAEEKARQKQEKERKKQANKCTFLQNFTFIRHQHPSQTYNERVLDGKVVGLYFSAHWCPPSRDFTPVLAQFYSQVEDNFEILFVSSDNNTQEMNFYLQNFHGDWFHLPLNLCNSMKHRNTKNHIPALIIMKPDGTVITDDGRNLVSQWINDPKALVNHWKAMLN